MIAPVSPEACFGGAETAALALAEAIAGRGHQVELIGLAGSAGRGLSVWTAPAATALMRPFEPAASHDRAPFLPIEAHLENSSFEVLHLHLNDPPAFEMAARLAKKMRVVATLHMAAVFPATTEAVRSFGQSMCFTAPSRYALDTYRLEGTVIPNGIAVDQLAFAPHAQSDRLVWAGRRSREKGLREALRIAELSGRPISIAGARAPESTPEEEQELAAAIARANADDRGLLSRDEVLELFRGAAALLVTSSIPESQSLVAIEALASGTPVIAFDAGAIREVIDDGVTGFIVPPGDVMAAATAVEAIPSVSRARCRAAALEKFDIRVMIDRFEAIYEGGR